MAQNPNYGTLYIIDVKRIFLITFTSQVMVTAIPQRPRIQPHPRQTPQIIQVTKVTNSTLNSKLN